MGNSTSALQRCIQAVANGRTGFAGFPGDASYQTFWVQPYNLDIKITPAAVVRPRTAEDVAGVVRCAVTNSVKIQARSGGHSYGNFGLGGVDGAVAIDMANFQHFSMDNSTWRATIGAGTHLGPVAEQLHNAGGRAIAQAVCPGIGMGGQMAIGGLGPMSRMWASSLDHVVEVEVVTADGSVRRASREENADLFWALRGAASSFGIVTEFVVDTHPEPAHVVQYEYAISLGNQTDMAPFYSAWQDLATDPALDRRFGTLFVVMPLGATVTGTFYGTAAEFAATGIPDRLPQGAHQHVVADGWLASLAHGAEQEGLWLASVPNPFYAKSLGFRREDLLPPDKVQDLFRWMDEQRKGTALWFVIFDASGGAVADVATNETAFVHRDKILWYQAYAVGLPLTQQTKAFITGFYEQVHVAVPQANGTYPGYVDPALPDAQQQYWGANLVRLQQLKAAWDPNDLFHNPQGVWPEGMGKQKRWRGPGVEVGR